MKLLPKSEIQKLKQAEQKQAVDEGVKLAKRVDRLREVASIEEQNLETYRVNALSRIQSEIVELTTTKSILQNEVKDLEERKKLALEPLDAEWQRLTACEAELKAKEIEIDTKIESLNNLLQRTNEAVQTAEKRIPHINTLEEVATKKATEAEDFHRETEQTLLDAKKLKEEIDTFAKDKETELTNREKQCADKENSIILREEKLEAEKTALTKEWQLLEDRKAMLTRNLKRINL